jgi:hypothetical protein
MDEKMKVYNEMSKKKFELDDKLNELEAAKDNYRESLVNETINDILNVLKEDGKLTERDLKLFLGNLALDVKHIYSR